jgi:hypothetical protein
VTLTDAPSDIDTVRAMAAARCQSLFSAQVLANNSNVGHAALLKFTQGRKLAPDAMSRLVAELSRGQSSWDQANERLVDIVKPATVAHSARAAG